jgi:S-DNA-T family DNA segregation ATPase FtsK/SpoIIIE
VPLISKYRVIALLVMAFLCLAALFLGLSVAGSFFDIPQLISLPGDFFVRSYGALAFLIPLYFIGAACILADPAYRPDRIFMLSASVVPFITLAAGFVLIRDFDHLAYGNPFLRQMGRVGISFCLILLILPEGLLIMVLSNRFFSPKILGKNQKTRTAIRLLPKVTDTPAGPTPPEEGESAMSGVETEDTFDAMGTFVPAIRQPGLISLPELKPLASAAAFRESEDAAHWPLLTRDAGGDPEGSVEESGETEEAGEAEETEETEDAEESLTPFFPAGIPPAGTVPKRPSRLPYGIPVEGILNQYPDGQYWIIDQGTRDAAETLRATLEEFHIQAEVTGIRKGPVITMFEILPAPGVKLSKIVNLQDNIALRLAASSVRIVAPIPGKHAVGIEVPNKKRNIVSFREIIEGELRDESSRDDKRSDHKGDRRPEIPVILGKDITGEAQTVDLVHMPHILIAGSTGSGKSVCVNAMILSILYQKTPAECRLILIDPKIVELKLYNDIPHLLTPVITEPKRAFQALQYCIYEMERRYSCLDSMGVRDIRSYNKRARERNIAAEHMPYIVVVIDEFADLMATTGKELESTVARLAAMSRAVGIHLVLATQRPSIDVITGLIKANIPSRIAFMVASKMDSRIIIDMVGAEKLLGKGDMLYAGAVDPFPVRMQGAFVSEEEVERVVEYVKTLGAPDYIDDEIFFDEDEEAAPSLFSDGEDPLYDKALEIVMQQGKASASYIQRRLKIGYNRAARLVEEMEQHGVVGPAQGSKPRELLRGV